MYTENPLSNWVYIHTKPNFTECVVVLSKLVTNKPPHNTSVAKGKLRPVQHSLGIWDPVASIPAVSMKAGDVCVAFSREITTDDLAEAAVEDDELLLTMLLIVVKLLVVVLGTLDATQPFETGAKEIIKNEQT